VGTLMLRLARQRLPGLALPVLLTHLPILHQDGAARWA
jgi:hypothetical protein